MWSSLVLALWVGGLSLVPAGQTCPTAEAIEAELKRIGVLDMLAAFGTTEVTFAEDRARLVVRERGGSVLGSREVAAPQGCDQRAAVAAALISAWLGQWRAREPVPPTAIAPAPVASPPGKGKLAPGRTAAAARVVPQREAEEPAEDVPPEPAVAMPPKARAEPAISEPRPPAHPGGSDLGLELGGFGLALHDLDAGALGAGAAASVGLPHGLAAQAWAATGTAYGRRLGPGRVAYRSSLVSAGPALQLRGRRRLAAEAGLLLALERLQLDARGLAANRSIVDWGFGARAQTRLILRTRPVAPFVLLGAGWRFTRETLTLADLPDRIELGRLTIFAGLGASLVLGESGP
jgi:hypothetical protein